MKPIPLSEEQIDKILENINPESIDKFWSYQEALNGELIVVDEDNDGKEVPLSQLPEEIIEEIINTLSNDLKIIHTNNISFYRKLNLVSFYNKSKDDYDYCELLECNNSASFFKIRDSRGTIYD